jgi:hypothetical protein
MSMIGNYLRVTKREIADLERSPKSIYQFLSSDVKDRQRTGRHLVVEKSWHGIHFLLNGDPWEGEFPLSHVVLGGTPIGEEDVGYGPARYLDPEEVRAVSRALDDLPTSQLLESFDAEAMNDQGIYPQGWRDNEEDREFISGYYVQVVDFFRRAAEANDGILLYLN